MVAAHGLSVRALGECVRAGLVTIALCLDMQGYRTGSLKRGPEAPSDLIPVCHLRLGLR